MIYLDDILIYSNNMFKHIKEVLKHLCKAGVIRQKCGQTLVGLGLDKIRYRIVVIISL